MSYQRIAVILLGMALGMLAVTEGQSWARADVLEAVIGVGLALPLGWAASTLAGHARSGGKGHLAEQRIRKDDKRHPDA
jgi:ABC-type antimicrobial peptide transport system permease subunit